MESTTKTRHGGDSRGGSPDRRQRKLWLLERFGNGIECACTHCSTPLVYDTLESDRIVPGGSYARWNIQPACRTCNAARGNDLAWIGPNPTGLEHPLEHLKEAA